MHEKGKSRPAARFWASCYIVKLSTLEAEILESFVEFGEPAAAVVQPVDACPGRMGLGVDVQFHGVARLTPGGPGGEGRAVGHLDGDFVVVGMDVFFHGNVSSVGYCCRRRTI